MEVFLQLATLVCKGVTTVFKYGAPAVDKTVDLLRPASQYVHAQGDHMVMWAEYMKHLNGG